MSTMTQTLNVDNALAKGLSFDPTESITKTKK